MHLNCSQVQMGGWKVLVGGLFALATIRARSL
jgi:hypothetical protein